MKKVLILTLLTIFVLALAAAVAMAADTSGSQSAPMSSTLPTLQASGETTHFQAADQDAAQAMCDKVAQQNNKSKCVAWRAVPKGQEQVGENVNAFYCTCE